MGLENSNGGEKLCKKVVPHLLLVTIAYPGHFAPQLQLLYHLEAKYPGLTVTVWANKDRISDLQKLQLKGDLKGLDLRLEEVFGEVAVYHGDPKFPIRCETTTSKCFEECQSYRDQLVAQKDCPGGPTAILADTFQHWSKVLADELDVPLYTYLSTGPSFTAFVAQFPKMIEAGIHPVKSSNLNDVLDPETFPGFPHVRIRDLPEETFSFENYFGELRDRAKRATAIILNISEELDSLAGPIAAVRKLWPSTRILPIGPSLQYPGFGTIYTSSSSSSNCLEWLGTQSAKSVLYVAFGSLSSVPKDWVMELAAGLEASGVSFLWALNLTATSKVSEWLPEGFVERTKAQGIIETGWAPQTRILAHSSIGGFLSHSGWNSTLESLCAGVPIISWPVSAEQPMNARFVADVVKVGLPICHFKDEDQESFEGITRQAVTKAVRKLMIEEKGDELRRNAAEVQKSLLPAVVEGGSSYRNLHLLLDELAGVRGDKADCIES